MTKYLLALTPNECIGRRDWAKVMWLKVKSTMVEVKFALMLVNFDDSNCLSGAFPWPWRAGLFLGRSLGLGWQGSLSIDQQLALGDRITEKNACRMESFS